MHQIMAAVLWILKFVKIGKKLQKNKFSKSVAVAAIWSPPGWSFCAPNYGRCLVDFEIRQQFKKVAKKQIFKICSRGWHLVTSGAVILWSQKSTLPPRTRDLRSSEIAFIDVGSHRMSAQHHLKAVRSGDPASRYLRMLWISHWLQSESEFHSFFQIPLKIDKILY